MLDSIICKTDDPKSKKRQQREAILKNVVFQIIAQKRQIKKQPSLSKFLKIFNSANKVQKEYLIKKFKSMYSGKLFIEKSDDFRFEKI